MDMLKKIVVVAGFVVASQSNAAMIADAEYNFEGASSYSDSIGTAHGTVTATTTTSLVAGYGSANALHTTALTDADGFMTVVNAYDPGTDNFIISFDYKIDTETVGDSAPRGLFDARGAAVGYQALIAGGDLIFRIDGDGGNILVTKVLGVVDDAWHHVEVTIDRTNGADVSINFDGTAGAGVGSNVALTGNISPDQDLRLGTFNYSGVSATKGLGGSLDNVVFSAVPEPASFGLIGLGVMALVGRRK